MLSTSHPSFKTDLQTARIARGLSGAELGRNIGISTGMLARYESETRTDKVLPNPETLKKINAVLFPVNAYASAPTIEQSDEEKADSLPLDVLIKAIKKRGAKDIVF